MSKLKSLIEEVELQEEMNKLRSDMEEEGRNGMKLIKNKWSEIRPRYEYYKKSRLSVKESFFYALLDNGIDPYGDNDDE